jgi:hypothetical protein
LDAVRDTHTKYDDLTFLDSEVPRAGDGATYGRREVLVARTRPHRYIVIGNDVFHTRISWMGDRIGLSPRRKDVAL